MLGNMTKLMILFLCTITVCFALAPGAGQIQMQNNQQQRQQDQQMYQDQMNQEQQRQNQMMQQQNYRDSQIHY